MEIKFSKMHGIGNDYIYINCFNQTIVNPEELAIRLSHRNFGIGGDGIVLIMRSDMADCRMRMFNIDGSEGKMCGNAVRCIGKYVYDNDLVRKEIITVETLSGIKTLCMTIIDDKVIAVEVDMGEPILEADLIPVISEENQIINSKMSIDNVNYKISCVSMGNPHCVIFTENIDNIDLINLGPKFENNKKFPERINTEFVEQIGINKFKMRVWERGSGETLACGTGACAVVVCAVLKGLATQGENLTISLRGGDLNIRWDLNGKVYMKGTATHVFDGVILI